MLLYHSSLMETYDPFTHIPQRYFAGTEAIVPWTKLSTRYIHSLAPGRCGCNLKWFIFKLISMINILTIPCNISFRWISQEHSGYLSTLVRVIAWCRQAPSHYQSHCRPCFMSPCGDNMPKWVKNAIDSSLCLAVDFLRTISHQISFLYNLGVKRSNPGE